MNLTAALRKSFATSPILAAAAYAGLVFALLVMLVSSIGDILRQESLALLVPLHARAQHREDRNIGNRHRLAPLGLGRLCPGAWLMGG